MRKDRLKYGFGAGFGVEGGEMAQSVGQRIWDRGDQGKDARACLWIRRAGAGSGKIVL